MGVSFLALVPSSFFLLWSKNLAQQLLNATLEEMQLI